MQVFRKSKFTSRAAEIPSYIEFCYESRMILIIFGFSDGVIHYVKYHIFHLIFWCGNFVGSNSFRRVSGNFHDRTVSKRAEAQPDISRTDSSPNGNNPTGQ